MFCGRPSPSTPDVVEEVEESSPSRGEMRAEARLEAEIDAGDFVEDEGEGEDVPVAVGVAVDGDDGDFVAELVAAVVVDQVFVAVDVDAGDTIGVDEEDAVAVDENKGLAGVDEVAVEEVEVWLAGSGWVIGVVVGLTIVLAAAIVDGDEEAE
jgi:hypothetical protein